MKLARFAFIILIALALVLGACTASPAIPIPGVLTGTPEEGGQATPLPASAVVAEGHIVPEHHTTLVFLAPGVVQEVNVVQGDQVEQGDVLMRLDTAGQAEAQLVAAQQELDNFLRTSGADHAAAWQAYMDAQKVREAAQEKWNDINLRDIENRIEDRQEDLQDRKEDLEEAQAQFDAVKDRGRDDSNYKREEDDLEHAQSDYDDALKDLESTMRERDVPRAALDAALAAEAEAKYQYELGLDGPNKDKLALLESQLAAARAVLASYVLTAPFDGLVMDVNVSVGDTASPELFAVKLADTSAWYVETSDLTELEVIKLSVGQPVTVIPDALPELELTGRITRISQAAVVQSGDVLYEVQVLLEAPDPRLMWGMTVEVIFETEG